MMQMFNPHCVPICGLYYNVPLLGTLQKTYLPQVEVKVHASILATTSRTVLQQTFINPSTTKGIREVRYTFPLYEGVGVVEFSCHVGDRLIVGEVKEKEKAKEIFNDAVARGETAGLLEQLPEASDCFTTTVGNIPPSARVVVNITYLGELKHDMEVDGIRFTIPTSICPRYGSVQGTNLDSLHQMSGTISITVDSEMAEGSFIQKVQSPSHPIAMSMGTTSTDPDATPSMSRASATLTLGVAHLDTDFILQVIAKDTGIPKAMLESHPTIPNHRALMATLVPKFALPPEKPEIVFVCDRSGSMSGSNITLAKEALQVFLKSLPVGVKFNICSFGNQHSFLFPRSASYGQDTLAQAVSHAERFQANYGGTQMLQPITATIENRYKDMPLDIILLTDGAIWNQQSLFDYLNEQIQVRKAPIRVFTLGIGGDVSHSLIEGVAKAGNGFSQSVLHGEKMSSKVVRMLKGALSPHVNDYTLEVKYSAAEDEDDFEVVEKVADSLKVKLDLKDSANIAEGKGKTTISLFDATADLDQAVPSTCNTGEERYNHLPAIPIPKVLQAPQSIPSLFAFNRTTVYLLLGPDAPHATPSSVVLRGTSTHGPLELEIPIQILDAPGDTIHQLAAKKAVSELEQGRGWLASASDADGRLLKTRFDGRFSEMVEREAVRLGVQFQVGGKWCSFVATEKTSATPSDNTEKSDEDWEFLEDEQPEGPGSAPPGTNMRKKTRAQSSQAHEQQQQQQIQMLQQIQQSHMQEQRPAVVQQQFGGIQGRSSPSLTQSVSGGRGGAPFFKKRLASGSRAAGSQASLSNTYTVNELLELSRSGGELPDSSASSDRPRRRQMMAAPRMCASPIIGSASTPSSLMNSAMNSTFGAAPPAVFAGANFSQGPNVAAPSTSGVPSASSNELQDYQMGLMLCEQQSRKRLLMCRQEQDTTMKRRASTELSKPEAVTGIEESYSPSSSSHWCKLSPPASPTSPPVSIPSPNFSPTSPGAAPASPAFLEPVSPPCDTATPKSAMPHLLRQTLSPRAPREAMHLLIAHQSFSGAFLYALVMLEWLGISVSDFARAMKEGWGDADAMADQNCVATAVAIVLLEEKVPECKDEWELVVDKAREWLENECVGREGGVDKVFGVARELLRSIY